MKRSCLTVAVLVALALPFPSLAQAVPVDDEATTAPDESAVPAPDAVAAPTATPIPSRATPARRDRALEEVVVTAVPLQPGIHELVTPVSVLAGEDLGNALRATLGETVANLPGVQTTAFGAGAGRPVIRGLDGPRVSILTDGMASEDASTVSQDHAVTIEPFLADQIEILKGPATLLFGSGAIGGVVNLVDGRIPRAPVDGGFAGRSEVRYDSVSDGTTAMFRADGGNERFALHADALDRNHDDYDTGDGRLRNSFVDTRAGALGGSWLTPDGYVGVSVSGYRSEYGNPAEPGDGDEPGVTLDVDQKRYDFRTGWRAPWSGVDSVELSASRTDYEHVEFEGDEVGTVFSNDADEGRLVFTTVPLAGWRNAIGVQAFDREFAAVGEETFVPPTRSRGAGVFVTGQRAFGPVDVEVGARVDDQHADPQDGARRDFSPASFSAGLSWRFDESWHLTLNLDRAQRAPAAEELFAHGPHIASATFEVGTPTLSEETANQAELGLHFHGGKLEANLSLYANRYDDFIYLADTGEIEDDLPVRVWSQADATFRGGEAEAIWHALDSSAGALDLRLWGDTVRARLRDGGDLPRIPAARVGVEATYVRDAWRASVGATRYGEQDRVAAFETPTAGFTLVDAHVSWRFHEGEGCEWQAFLDALNLTDRTARLATSLIKDQVPLPGRNIVIGVRGTF